MDEIDNMDNVFNITVYNVGQGDHILLKFPNNEYGFIDFHFDENVNPITEPPGLTYLKKRKSEGEKIVIAFLCISHNDYDHIKGVENVLKWIRKEKILVKKIWLSGAPDPTKLRKNFILSFDKMLDDLTEKERSHMCFLLEDYKTRLEAIEDLLDDKEYISFLYRNGVRKKDLCSHLSGIQLINYEVCENLDSVVLAPLASELHRYYDKIIKDSASWAKSLLKQKLFKKSKRIDRNDMSTIVKFSYKNRKFIFGGDAHRRIWNNVFKNYMGNISKKFGSLNSMFIKSSHHGSKHSSTLKIWDYLIEKKSKGYVVISAGKDNLHDHPHPETIEHIKEIARRKESEILILKTNEEIIQSYTDDEVSILNLSNEFKVEKNIRDNIEKEIIGDLASVEGFLLESTEYSDFVGYRFTFD